MKPKKVLPTLLVLSLLENQKGDSDISPWNYAFNLTFNPMICHSCWEYRDNCSPMSAVIEKIIKATPQHVSIFQGDSSVVGTYATDHIFFTGSPAVGKHAWVLQKILLQLRWSLVKESIIAHESANLIKQQFIVFSKFLNNDDMYSS